MEIKINAERISNGLYFLLAGFVLLWMSLGFVRWNMIFQFLRLWPLFFIIVGIDFIFARTRFALLRLVSPVLVIGAFISIIYVTQDGDIFHPADIEKQKISQETILPQKITDFNVDFTSGRLQVSEGEKELIKADIFMPKNERPQFSFNNFEKEYLYKVSDSSKSGYVFSPWDKNHAWDVKINKETPMKINAKTYASINEFDLSKLSVSEFFLKSSASSSRIILNERTTKVKIGSSGSKIVIEVPRKSGIKINLDKMFIFDNLEELGLERGYKEYTSKNYNESDNKVELSLDLKFSQIEILFY